MNLQIWKDYIDSLPYEPLFVTVSGAHIYGFPSPDSDVDLRGCHLLPLEKIVGLSKTREKATVAIDWEVHRQRLDGLAERMEQVQAASSLPDNADRQAINEFLVAIRLGQLT